MNRFCRSVGMSVACAAVVLVSVAGTAMGTEPPAQTWATAQPSPILNKSTIMQEGDGQGNLGLPFHARFPGCQPTANCQEAGGTPAVTGRASCTNAPTPYIVADNFRLSGTGTVHINNICFWGYYGVGSDGAGAGVPTAGNETWRIRILPNLNGLPDLNNPVATLFVGSPTAVDTAVIGYPGPTGGTNGNGTSGVFTRGTSIGPSPFGAVSPEFPFNVTGLNIAVPANTCLWLEIGGANAGTDNNNRTRWSAHSVTPQSPVSDGVSYQTNLLNGGYTYSDLTSSGFPPVAATNFDRAWCIGTTEGSNIGTVPPPCNVPAVPPNATCATATQVGPGSTHPFPYIDNTNTLRATLATTPFCGTNVVVTNSIWYKGIGDGTTWTVDTCGVNTNFDTVINVYCGATCGTNNASLFCVANNDDSATACTGDGGVNTHPSRVSFIATTGVQYDIAVFGYSNTVATRGFVDVQIQSDGVQAANPPACVSDRCPVSIAGITVESDACGVSNNDACNGTSVGTFVLGTDFGGTNYNTGAARDFDFWRCGTPLTDNGDPGKCWLLCNYHVEYYGVIFFYTGPCTPTNIGGAFTNYRPFAGAPCATAQTRGIFVDAASGTDFWVNPTTAEFAGIPCAAGTNNYRINVTLAAVGSCCQVGLVCTVNPQVICTSVVGSLWAAGGTCSPSDPCTGTCCDALGVCSTSTFDVLCAAGSVYTAGASCTPNPCPQPPSGVCCRGATCATGFANLAACSATLIGGQQAGAAYPTGAACNGANISNSPCCYANYNHDASITVTDIFDFLADWFAGSPYANTGGTGAPAALAVQNIFDFLTNWFNGGCN